MHRPGSQDPPASPFLPAPWLPGGHAQTLWPFLFRRRPRLASEREVLPTPDGDRLLLDWHRPPGWRPGRPVVLLLHGLGGSARSPYLLGLAAALGRRGWAAVGLNLRGAGGEPNDRPRFFHAAETGDPAHVLRTLARRYPGTPLAAVGFSLGGQLLLRYLGEVGEGAGLRAAAAVSVPLDLAGCVARIGSGFSRCYDVYLTRCLKKRVAAKARRGGLPLPREAWAQVRGLRAFDERVTAPLHGFRDADHYYREADCRPWLGRIRVPTLLVQARDDPFVPPAALVGLGPWLAGGAVRLELLPRGGHVGFVGGSPWRPRYWLEERLPAFLAGRLEA